MSDEFKKWVCEKAGTEYKYYDDTVQPGTNNRTREIDEGILIKAMWAINKEGNYRLEMDDLGIHIFNMREEYVMAYLFKDYNSIELEALKLGLDYIFKEYKKTMNENND